MKNVAMFVAIGVVFGLGLGVAPSWAASLVVNDFDSGEKPNNVGGDFGVWNKDETDVTQGVIGSFDDDHYGNAGRAFRLEYDVDSPNPAYNGFWTKLNGADALKYKTLAFAVKGDAQNGFTSQVKVELKNMKGQVGKYLVKGITNQWQEVKIPFDQLRGLTDWSSMNEFVIVFDDITSTKKTGTILVDNIRLE